MTVSIKKMLAASAAICMTMVQGMLLPVSAQESTPDFSDLGAIGVFTEEETEKIAAAIYQGLAEGQPKISMRGEGMPVIGIDEASTGSLQLVFKTVASGWDVGILTDRRKIMWGANSKGVTSIVPTYLVAPENYAAEYENMMLKLDEITAEVDPNLSDLEKALFLHEWMAENCSYDYTEYADPAEEDLRHTAYAMLTREKAVCEGYSQFYTMLLHRVGVNSMIVESKEANHGWNLVEIGDSWYHVDVTGDDSSNALGRVEHTRFMKSTDAMHAAGLNGSDWTLVDGTPVSEMPVSDQYDNGGFWDGGGSSMQKLEDGSWVGVYAVEGNETTVQFKTTEVDPVTGEIVEKHLFHLSDLWYVAGTNQTKWYTSSYAVTDVYQGILFYTTPYNMMAYNNGNFQWLFGLTEEQKADGSAIYGMHIDDGIMYYYTSPDPLSEPTEHMVNLADFSAQLGLTDTPQEETEASTEAPDQNVGVVDVVAIQRYLLGEDVNVADHAEYDLTCDGVVDGFDLALLKRALLTK